MVTVTLGQVLGWRLRRQYLTDPGPSVVTIAERLCGVQAQVASSAVHALSIRLGRPASADVTAALEDRSLVKLWACRGTLHLMTAELAARACAANDAVAYWQKPGWLRGSGVTREEMDALLEAVASILPDRVLPRDELVGEIVERTGSKHLAESLRSGWGSLLKPAAYAGLVCNGPPNGTKVTFTAPSTWVPGWSMPDADEAGRRLVLDYLGAYGPATAKDFGMWLMRDLKPPLTKRWFASAADELTEVTVDGTAAHLPSDLVDDLTSTPEPDGVRLLGPFDQYVIAVSRDLIPADHRAKVSRTAGWISPVILKAGRIAGVWTPDPLTFDPFTRIAKRTLTAAHAAYAEAVGS